MNDRFLKSLLALACALGLALPAQAAGEGGLGSLLGKGGSGGIAGALGDAALSSLGLPDIGGGAASSIGGNVAGVLEYCVKNNYLKKANAGAIKDTLLQKAGFGAQKPPEQDNGYASGLTGMLMGKDGKSFDLTKIQDNVKEKACDYVLDKAPSLL